MLTILLYLLVGGALATWDAWKSPPRGMSRGGRLGNALLYLLLWPLWAPICLLGGDSEPTPGGATSERIGEALREAAATVISSNLHSLLPARVVTEVSQCARLLEQRQRELREAVRREEAAIESASPPSALRRRNLEQLRALYQRNDRALTSLETLAESLRGQLLLVRHSGASADGVAALIEELASSVDSLSEWTALEHE